MSKFNAVFSGVKPISASEFYLVYSIFSGRVDFDKIHIADPAAGELKEHIRKLWEEFLKG